MSLPEPVQGALVRAVGTYLRTTDQNELPPNLKRLRSFRPAALAKHKTELLGALDLEATRALILQWLDDAKPPLGKGDATVLRAAATAGTEWRTSFAIDPQPERDTAATDAEIARLRDLLEREKDRSARARESERAAKEALKQATTDAAKKDSGQTRALAALRAELEELKREVNSHRVRAAKAADERAGERRRAERALERERRARQDAESALKSIRRELRDRDAELAQLKSRSEGDSPRREERNRVSRSEPESPATRRTRLKAPPGLLDDDPKSLLSWLRTDGVQLLVDGYNVSKSGAGFAHLSLEDQRKRVVQAVNGLARKNDLTPIVVFDGAETPPGTSRRGRGPAVVEYSSGEIADDHLIARLENLPSAPVVFVTDDKELQGRAAALGATIATSKQLLALAR